MCSLSVEGSGDNDRVEEDGEEDDGGPEAGDTGTATGAATGEVVREVHGVKLGRYGGLG